MDEARCGAVVTDNAIIAGEAVIGGNANISDEAVVYGKVCDYALVYDRYMVVLWFVVRCTVPSKGAWFRCYHW